MCEKKDYIWNAATWACENGKYLKGAIDNLVIMCDIIDETKTVSTTSTSTNFYYFNHLFINYYSNIDNCLYCSLIKYQSKQKHLLPYHNSIGKLKEININKVI